MPSVMKAILLVPGLLVANLLGGLSAAAQTYDPRYPVCIEIYTVDGSTIDCSFTTIVQCDRVRAICPVLRQPLCNTAGRARPIAAATEPRTAATRSVHAYDVRTAEIDQALHRREAIIEGCDGEQQIVTALVEQAHLGAGQFCVRPLPVNVFEGLAQSGN